MMTPYQGSAPKPCNFGGSTQADSNVHWILFKTTMQRKERILTRVGGINKINEDGKREGILKYSFEMIFLLHQNS